MVRVWACAKLRTARPATAALLRDLAQRCPADRVDAVTKALTRSLDVARLREALATLASAGQPLRVLCNALFVYLFLVGPALMLFLSVARLWPALLTLLVALVLAIAIQYRRVHRRLWPVDRIECRNTLVHLCLYPPAAIRSYDALAHRLCAPHYPAAVAVVLCDAPVRDRFLRRLLLALRFSGHVTAGATPNQTHTWCRAAVEAQIHRLLVEQGLHLAAYLDPPAQTDRSSLSYCPRCEVEYAVLAGTCSDCTGVSLVAFAPTYARVSA
jgi:hypothetical protein